MKCNVQGKALIQFLLNDGAPDTQAHTHSYPQKKMDLPASCGLRRDEQTRPASRCGPQNQAPARREQKNQAPARREQNNKAPARRAQSPELRPALVPTTKTLPLVPLALVLTTKTLLSFRSRRHLIHPCPGGKGAVPSSLPTLPHWTVLACKMSVDWAPRPLIGPGDLTTVQRTALQTGRGTLSCVGCGHWTTAEELARIPLIGREPPRGSSLNSTHHGCHGVGQSKVKVRVMLVL